MTLIGQQNDARDILGITKELEIIVLSSILMIQSW